VSKQNTNPETAEPSDEVVAMGKLYGILKDFDTQTRARMLKWVDERLMAEQGQQHWYSRGGIQTSPWIITNSFTNPGTAYRGRGR